MKTKMFVHDHEYQITVWNKVDNAIDFLLCQKTIWLLFFGKLIESRFRFTSIRPLLYSMTIKLLLPWQILRKKKTKRLSRPEKCKCLVSRVHCLTFRYISFCLFSNAQEKKDEKRIIPIVMEIPSMLWSLIVKRSLITSFYSENKEEILSGYAIVSEYCCNI